MRKCFSLLPETCWRRGWWRRPWAPRGRGGGVCPPAAPDTCHLNTSLRAESESRKLCRLNFLSEASWPAPSPAQHYTMKSMWKEKYFSWLKTIKFLAIVGIAKDFRNAPKYFSCSFQCPPGWISSFQQSSWTHLGTDPTLKRRGIVWWQGFRGWRRWWRRSKCWHPLLQYWYIVNRNILFMSYPRLDRSFWVCRRCRDCTLPRPQHGTS